MIGVYYITGMHSVHEAAILHVVFNLRALVNACLTSPTALIYIPLISDFSDMLRSLARLREVRHAHNRTLVRHAAAAMNMSTSAQTSLERIVAEDPHFDAVVIGAGIGGAAAALGLTTPQLATPVATQLDPSGRAVRDLSNPTAGSKTGKKSRVLVIDAEKHFCYHSTGRSAAIFSELYGTPTTQALSIATKPFLYAPKPNGLTPPGDTRLVSRRGNVWLATEDSKEAMIKLYEESVKLIPSLRIISPEEVAKLVPWAIASNVRPRSEVEARCNAFGEDDAAALGLSAEAVKMSSTAVCGAILEPDAADMDVDAIWKTMVDRARANGANFEAGVCVERVGSSGTGGKSWELELVQGHNSGASGATSVSSQSSGNDARRVRITTDLVLNAGGAWADKVAEQFGFKTVGLVPKRRTIMQFSPLDVAKDFRYPLNAGSPGIKDPNEYLQHANTWPAVFDMADKYYYKPDAGRILASPCDETPTDPCDAQPDEVDLALCAHRIQAASFLEPQNMISKWAGLRSFVRDKNFVVGFDSRRVNSNGGGEFFWLAGLGGYGIQTSLGNARLIAGLVHEGRVPADLEENGLELRVVTPNRFM